MITKRALAVLILAGVAVVAVDWLIPRLREHFALRMSDKKTVGDRLAEFGDTARKRLRPAFDAVGVAYPPKSVVLVALKANRTLSIYGGDTPDTMCLVATYPILGQSGALGPKLREGDFQVPEGIYSIEGLNPNSNFYVSLRLNYPNDFDRQMAAADGRDKPGSDIYIHGGSASVGCLAMGDPAIEELFTLVEDCGQNCIQVIIAPDDLRVRNVEARGGPPWLGDLYGAIRRALATLPFP